jgi:hypothetical protein
LLRFDEAIEQYHRALSLQPSLAICGDLLSQALEDMRIYSSESAPTATRNNYLNSLLHTSSQATAEEELTALMAHEPLSFRQLSALATPTSSFVIHGDDSQNENNDRRGGAGGGYDGHSISLIGGDEHDGDCSAISASQQLSFLDSGHSPFDHFEEDSNSVESYSRIAGRLSLGSSESGS